MYAVPVHVYCTSTCMLYMYCTCTCIMYMYTAYCSVFINIFKLVTHNGGRRELFTINGTLYKFY